MKSKFETIKDKIGNANHIEAIEELIVLADNSSYLNEILVIKSRLEKVNRETRMGTVEYSQAGNETNQIAIALLNIIEKLKIIDKNETLNSPDAIIGIDFGDGESSVSIGLIEQQNQINPVEFSPNVFSVPSIIARQRIGIRELCVIGNSALDYVDDLEEFDINFKWSPVREKEQWESRKSNILSFVEILYQKVEAQNPNITKNCDVFVGCPSNWNDEEKKSYKEMFDKSTILPEVSIVPESRAALLQFFNISEVKLSLFNKTTVIIDIGSSTTDISVIDNFKVSELSLERNDLGLRLVDERILYTFFKNHPNGDEIKAKLEKEKNDYIKQLYFCRKARELAQGRNLTIQNTKDWKKFYGDFILSLGLENILSDDRFYGNDPTFIESYSFLLKKLSEKIPIKNIDLIILTGGGAQIKEIQKTTEFFFGKKPIYVQDLFNISQGITKFGILQYNFQKFQNDVENLIQKVETNEYLLEKLRTFYADFVKAVALTSTDAIWRPIAYQWKDNELNLQEKGHLKSYMLALYQKWLTIPQNSQQFDAISQQLSQYVNKSIDNDVAYLFKKYKFPIEEFKVNIKFNPTDLFDANSPGSVFFNEMIHEFQDVLFKIVDKIPKFIRNIVPKGLIDFSLDAEELTKRIMGAALKSLIEEGQSKNIDNKIINYVKGGIRREFDENSTIIKYFLSTNE